MADMVVWEHEDADFCCISFVEYSAICDELKAELSVPYRHEITVIVEFYRPSLRQNLKRPAPARRWLLWWPESTKTLIFVVFLTDPTARILLPACRPIF